MYQFAGFSEKANLALNNAVNCAEDMGHTYIGSEHIMAGILKDPGCVAGVVLRSRKVTYKGLYDTIKSSVGIGIPTELTIDDMTPRCRRIIENALSLSASAGIPETGTEHILMAVLKDNKCIANRLLKKMGVSAAEIYSDIICSVPNGNSPVFRSFSNGNDSIRAKTENSVLAKYGVSLTEEAKAGHIDPVSGRDNEIDRVIRILCRRTKNNPCLIGLPGVGKTAVAEGLALRIAAGDVPDALKNNEIISLELTGMVAGAKYRGDFEERIRNAVKEVKNAGNIILFIDEIHNLIGAGSAEGAVDAANILKPVLARGEIRIIGATTSEEYRRNIEKDAALERRFQTVLINEPDEEQTLTILKELRPRYEAHHKIRITDEALKNCVVLSERYITDRALPDKAIDLMDEAMAGGSLRYSAYPEEIEEMKKESEQLNRQKADAVNRQDFETAVSIRDSEKELNKKLSAAKAKWNEDPSSLRQISEDDIADIVAQRTGIPAGSMKMSDREKLRNLEEKLKEKITGQNEAVAAVAAAVRRGRSGVKDPAAPTGTFLFCGPTGVGKTELAKQLAYIVFGSKDALIRIDMSEYSEKHTVSKLLGAPPGYVGFEDGGQLTEKIRRHPYSVILFDETEKAHPDIFNTLLQMLDDGILTSSDGTQADCRNCIIIMTSNAGAELTGNEKTAFGFSENTVETDRKNMHKAIEGELKRIFRPEFLNRIDEIVVFDRLNESAISVIAEKYLSEIELRLAGMGISLNIDEAALKYIAKHGYDSRYGARYLKRSITAEIENPIADAIIDGKFDNCGKIDFYVADGRLLFRIS